ncbi:DNA-3-methyladenine glycosylase 2 family protein, partial [archaeon]|nr:DNA-3-methyladenine glycosylase 2 family protein [archaeon]
MIMTNIFDEKQIEIFLKSAPNLRKFMSQVNLELRPTMSPPFDRLIESVIFQQLSGKAASTIFGRFVNLVEEVTPENILMYKFEDFRGVGLSSQKAQYVHNIANEFKVGGSMSQYSDAKSLDDLSNKEIISLFSQIKGVGEWTVEMYLIFGLGRLDVFSSKDLGVRKGLQKMY